MTTTTSPQDVLAAADQALGVLSGLPSRAVAGASREEWCAALAVLQQVVDVATAVQDEAIVAVAALEPQWAEDGTLVEVREPFGHVALDAPSIVSGVLNVSAVHAERRVRDAVRRAADGAEGSASCTGLGGLHAAMREGRLDGYPAQVVAYELEEVPAPVAETVVASLQEWFEVEDGSHLRRRARRLLARISPDLLRQRAVRAREASGLRRWVDEPGVDTWLGTFPSEEACTAWAAIDALAQQYVADGVCSRIDRARAKALTDLVTSNATIDVQVVLTTPVEGGSVPASAAGAGINGFAVTAADPSENAAVGVAGRAATDLVQVDTGRAGEPLLVERGWLERAVAATAITGRDRVGRPRILACDTGTGAPVDPDGDLTTSAYRPSPRLATFVRARDRHCRFPGCAVAARYCDLDHVRPYPAGPTSSLNLVCLCRRHHRIKQRPGWRVTLHPDATMTWTDPTGRTRTTHPPDQLHPIALPDAGTDPPPPEPGNPSLVLPDGPHSALEHHLEHHPETVWTCRVHLTRPRVRMTLDTLPTRRPRRRPSSAPEAPPF
ncbi:HNH endonuclease signature motif containing protein [Phycicoccus avicenniae]|uniref:HNH endonuclease signature motif containing protein n=1 Tax=Phycicoccus avicenniae TaxID=2828860 RepID=UPI003D2A14FC